MLVCLHLRTDVKCRSRKCMMFIYVMLLRIGIIIQCTAAKINETQFTVALICTEHYVFCFVNRDGDISFHQILRKFRLRQY